MDKIKAKNLKLIEQVVFALIITFIVINGIIVRDYSISIISAICGISYTAFAGKGNPYCYLFGVVGSIFYCILSYKSALWGNLLLYLLYYIPMQIFGFFSWGRHLQADKHEIVKTKSSKRSIIVLWPANFLGIIACAYLLLYFNDPNPLLDSAMTILSISGMYLTVKRAIEQWYVWGIVNFLGIILWYFRIVSGEKVYSTLIMWVIYFLLAFYFYFTWKRELKIKQDL